MRENRRTLIESIFPQGKSHAMMCPEFKDELTPYATLETSYPYYRDEGWVNRRNSDILFFKYATPVYLNDVSTPQYEPTVLENTYIFYNFRYFSGDTPWEHKHSEVSNRLFLEGHIYADLNMDFGSSAIKTGYCLSWA